VTTLENRPSPALLVVVGAPTDACIRSTLDAALVRGYDASLVSDDHTTAGSHTSSRMTYSTWPRTSPVSLTRVEVTDRAGCGGGSRPPVARVSSPRGLPTEIQMAA
jgi:hypothetical protein